MEGRIKMEIRKLRAEETERAVKVLVDAFEKEGFTKTVYDFSKQDTKKLFYCLALLKARVYMLYNNTILVAEKGGEILGIAILKRDIKIPFSAYYESGKREVKNILKLFARMRWKKAFPLFNAMKEPDEIKNSCITIEAIATDPKWQGSGVGKALLNEIELIAKKEKKSIYLFTADEKNRDIYLHFGYNTIAERKGGSLKVYHMMKKV